MKSFTQFLTEAAHTDSIPRNASEEKKHQAALDAENWHTKTMARFKDKPDSALHFIQKDAAAAAKANPDSRKASQYEDEVHYASMELEARRKHREKSK